MDNPDLSALKQLELEENHPEAVKSYTQMKGELEKNTEEMKDMYGRLLMRMVDATHFNTAFISMKRNMKIAHDSIQKYERERKLAINESDILLKK